jgi:predicted ester cyclase
MPTDILEANKTVVRRFIDEVFLRGSKEAVDELTTEDFSAHTYGPRPVGRDGLKAAIDRVSGVLADETMRLDDLIAEGDRVAVRMTASARPIGSFMGIEPSGRRYEIGEIHWFELRDGRIAAHWHQADFLGMRQQLGASGGSNGS